MSSINNANNDAQISLLEYKTLSEQSFDDEDEEHVEGSAELDPEFWGMEIKDATSGDNNPKYRRKPFYLSPDIPWTDEPCRQSDISPHLAGLRVFRIMKCCIPRNHLCCKLNPRPDSHSFCIYFANVFNQTRLAHLIMSGWLILTLFILQRQMRDIYTTIFDVYDNFTKGTQITAAIVLVLNSIAWIVGILSSFYFSMKWRETENHTQILLKLAFPANAPQKSEQAQFVAKSMLAWYSFCVLASGLGVSLLGFVNNTARDVEQVFTARIVELVLVIAYFLESTVAAIVWIEAKCIEELMKGHRDRIASANKELQDYHLSLSFSSFSSSDASHSLTSSNSSSRSRQLQQSQLTSQPQNGNGRFYAGASQASDAHSKLYKIFRHVSTKWHVWITLFVVVKLLNFSALWILLAFSDSATSVFADIPLWYIGLCTFIIFAIMLIMVHLLAVVNRQHKQLLRDIWLADLFRPIERAALQKQVTIQPLSFTIFNITLDDKRLRQGFFSTCAISLPVLLRYLIQ